jgi:predicted dehydrogenase
MFSGEGVTVNVVRVLIVGVGGMGREHIEVLKHFEDVRIVGLVDPSHRSIAATRDRFPDLIEVPSFADVGDAVAAVEADAAVIVSPHSLHLDHGLACLDAGLHVLMEKPFVSGAANAELLLERALKKGRRLAVSYQRHLEGPYVYLRDLVRSGALGRILVISAYQAQRWLAGTIGSWRQDPALSCGGQLNDSGSHLLDVVLWITGLQPIEVSATIDNRGTRVDIDSAVSVRFDGGALATFVVAGSVLGSEAHDVWEDISIHGDNGTALYRVGKLLVARDGSRDLIEVPAEHLRPDGDPDRDFIDLIQGRVPEAAAPASCGLAVARLTEAIFQSAELGRPVSLPLSFVTSAAPVS